MEYYIQTYSKTRNTAGSKAPQDIFRICEKNGMQSFSMPRYSEEKNSVIRTLKMVVGYPYYWHKFARIVLKDDAILWQHPTYGPRSGAYGNRVARSFISRIKRKKQSKFVVLIHDLESLRYREKNKSVLTQRVNRMADNELLQSFDVIICHNNNMKEYLSNCGFDDSKIISLEIFDYCCTCEKQKSTKGARPSIAIAGKLASRKSEYLYQMVGHDAQINKNLLLHLYGTEFDKKRANDHMIYHGSYEADLLPEQLEGDFGLVWDGPSAATCMGNTGEYLKYNNPHKTSLYLASGMPVIVWSQAAIADFVLKNGVGITVENLYNLDQVISNISDCEYRAMCYKVKKIGEKIRSGYYFTEAWIKAVKIIRG